MSKRSRRFISASIRAKFMRRDMTDEILSSLARKVGAVREGVLKHLEKVVACNYLREVLMVFGDTYMNAIRPRIALLWLQDKAGIGGAHLL